MQRFAIFAVLLLAMTLSVGCATTSGNPIDTSYVQSIEEGVTTKAEVRENLGEPQQVTMSGDGEIWMYHHAEGPNILDANLMAMGAKEHNQAMESLQLHFNSNGVVERRVFSTK